MKTVEAKDKKVPAIWIDKELNKYDNIVLFPEKLVKANEKLQKAGLAKKK